ncbi:MAG TPA: VWA domain-containing protein [Vicinamibacterales bacterium]
MPMDFKAARSRVRGLVASKRPQDLQRSALTADPLRDDIIHEAIPHVERFKTALRKTPTVKYEVTHEDADGNVTKEQREFDWTAYPELLRDVAKANFGFDEPELVSADKMKASHRLNREVMAQRLISDSFMSSRPYTRGNETESLFGAIAEANSYMESAQTILAEHIARSNQMEEQENEIESAEDMLERLRNLAKREIEQGDGVTPDTRRKIKGQVKRRERARDVLGGLIQDMNTSTIVQDAIAAANNAAKAGEDAIDAMHSLPGLGGGQSQNMTPDQQIALAEKWAMNSRLREIARMLGRMYRDMRFRRETRVKNVPIEPVGVTVGDSFERMLPMEGARAVSNDRLAKFTFIRDWTQGNLLEYEMSGKMPAGKGPCIAVVDGSGSMNGEKIVWANSLCLSVMTLMHREGRDFAAIQFGSGKSQIKVWRFPKGQAPDPDEVLDMASHLFGGGTTTVEGMAAALDIVEHAPEFKTADVLLIADGQDRFSERDTTIRNRLRERDVRIHGISIMAPNNHYMEQMCEYVEDVIDLAGANDATTKVAQNLT